MKIVPLIIMKEKEFLEEKKSFFKDNYKKYLKFRFLPLLKVYSEDLAIYK